MNKSNLPFVASILVGKFIDEIASGVTSFDAVFKFNIADPVELYTPIVEIALNVAIKTADSDLIDH